MTGTSRCRQSAHLRDASGNARRRGTNSQSAFAESTRSLTSLLSVVSLLHNGGLFPLMKPSEGCR